MHRNENMEEKLDKVGAAKWRIRMKEKNPAWTDRGERRDTRKEERNVREERKREGKRERKRGERVQHGHSSHDIKRGCRPLETRPTDSKDSGRSAMKRGRTVRRNRKKIGKNEGKEETAGADFVRVLCCSHSCIQARLISYVFVCGGAIQI